MLQPAWVQHPAAIIPAQSTSDQWGAVSAAAAWHCRPSTTSMHADARLLAHPVARSIVCRVVLSGDVMQLWCGCERASPGTRWLDQCLCCLLDPTEPAGSRYTGELRRGRVLPNQTEQDSKRDRNHAPYAPSSATQPHHRPHSNATAATPAAMATSTRDTTAAPAADPGVVFLQASDDAAAPTHAVPVSRLGPGRLSASSQGAFCRACRLRAREPPHVWVLSPGQGVVQPVLGPRAFALSSA